MNNNNNITINFNLAGLDQLIERAEDNLKNAVSEEKAPVDKMESFRRIVKGVSRKYASKWVDAEDLEQELWIKVLEIIADFGGDENSVDDNLVAKACYRKAVDYYRYCRRRYESTCEYIPEAFEGEDSDLLEDYTKFYKTHSIVKDTDYVTFTEVINLFPVGSQERDYVIMKLAYYGDLDPEFWEEKIVLPTQATAKDGDYREVDFLSMIGYNGKKVSGSWINKKNRMRAEVEDYLKGLR